MQTNQERLAQMRLDWQQARHPDADPFEALRKIKRLEAKLRKAG